MTSLFICVTNYRVNRKLLKISSKEPTIMMSEIEDKVMVKANNSSNPKQPQRNSAVTKHKEASSLYTSSSLLHEAHDNFSVLKELIFDAPDINHARVEHLKKEIASGSYQIASKQIAMRMLSNF
jgi:flagellar biosynthesis anti-sigma factor FlgM